MQKFTTVEDLLSKVDKEFQTYLYTAFSFVTTKYLVRIDTLKFKIGPYQDPYATDNIPRIKCKIQWTLLHHVEASASLIICASGYEIISYRIPGECFTTSNYKAEFDANVKKYRSMYLQEKQLEITEKLLTSIQILSNKIDSLIEEVKYRPDSAYVHTIKERFESGDYSDVGKILSDR